MSKQNENKKRPVHTPDTRIEEGLDDINSANGNSQDNVISSTHKKIEDEKHGRKHGEPLTGTTPKGID